MRRVWAPGLLAAFICAMAAVGVLSQTPAPERTEAPTPGPDEEPQGPPLPATVGPVPKPSGGTREESTPEAAASELLRAIREKLALGQGPRPYAGDLCALARLLHERPGEFGPILFAVLRTDPDNRMRIFAALILGFQKTAEIEAELRRELDRQTDGDVLVAVLYALLSKDPIQDPSQLYEDLDGKIVQGSYEELWTEVLQEFPDIYSAHQLFLDLREYAASHAGRVGGYMMASIPSHMVNYYVWSNGEPEIRGQDPPNRRLQSLLIALASDPSRPERLRLEALRRLPPWQEYSRGVWDGLYEIALLEENEKVLLRAVNKLPWGFRVDAATAQMHMEYLPQAIWRLENLGSGLRGDGYTAQDNMAKALGAALARPENFERALEILPALPPRAREEAQRVVLMKLFPHDQGIPVRDPEKFRRAWALADVCVDVADRAHVLAAFAVDLDGSVRRAALDELLPSENFRARRSGCYILARHGFLEDIPTLERLASSDASAEVQQASLEVIDRIKKRILEGEPP